MQTTCDRCDFSVKKVGRLNKVYWRGMSQKLCKKCKNKIKMSVK